MQTQSSISRDTLIEQGRSGEDRFFYGWVMLPIATLGMVATSPGQTFGVSVFNESFRTSLGLSHSQLTGAYMLGTFLASLPMTYIGALMDRYGLRLTMGVVVVLFGAACMLVSQVSGLFTLFLAFFGLRMLGQGALGLLSGNTLAFWFERRLGTVEGMRMLGMAGAIAVIPAANLWLIDAVGWRGAYVVLGLAVWTVMLPLILFVFRNGPEETGQCKDGLPPADPEPQNGDAACPPPVEFTFAETLRTRSFWIAAAVLAVWGMTNTAVLFNIIPLFASRGLGASDAAMLFTTFALCLAVTHLVGGYLADRVPLNRLMAAASAGMAVTMFMIWQVSTPSMVYLSGAVMGLSQGLVTAAGAPLWPRYFGRLHLGRIRGLTATFMVASSSIGPFLMGATVDLLGSYGPILIVFAVLPIPLAVLALLATPPVHPSRRGTSVDPGGIVPEANA